MTLHSHGSPGETRPASHSGRSRGRWHRCRLMSPPPPPPVCLPPRWACRGVREVWTSLAASPAAEGSRPCSPGAARGRSDVRAHCSSLGAQVTARSSLPKFQPRGGASGHTAEMFSQGRPLALCFRSGDKNYLKCPDLYLSAYQTTGTLRVHATA